MTSYRFARVQIRVGGCDVKAYGYHAVVGGRSMDEILAAVSKLKRYVRK